GATRHLRDGLPAAFRNEPFEDAQYAEGTFVPEGCTRVLLHPELFAFGTDAPFGGWLFRRRKDANEILQGAELSIVSQLGLGSVHGFECVPRQPCKPPVRLPRGSARLPCGAR